MLRLAFGSPLAQVSLPVRVFLTLCKGAKDRAPGVKTTSEHSAGKDLNEYAWVYLVAENRSSI